MEKSGIPCCHTVVDCAGGRLRRTGLPREPCHSICAVRAALTMDAGHRPPGRRRRPTDGGTACPTPGERHQRPATRVPGWPKHAHRSSGEPGPARTPAPGAGGRTAHTWHPTRTRQDGPPRPANLCHDRGHAPDVSAVTPRPRVLRRRDAPPALPVDRLLLPVPVVRVSTGAGAHDLLRTAVRLMRDTHRPIKPSAVGTRAAPPRTRSPVARRAGQWQQLTSGGLPPNHHHNIITVTPTAPVCRCSGTWF